MIVGLLSFVFARERNKKISLKEEYIQIEYGENYSPKIEDLIDLSKFYFVDASQIKIESDMKKEENNNYFPIGKYKIILYYKNVKLIQIVEVKDTIAPILNIQEKVEVEKNTDLTKFDFNKVTEVSDLSIIKEFKVDYSKVDVSKAGEYLAKIYVEDISNNKTEKEFKIIVLEPKEKQEIVENKESISKEQSNTISKSVNKKSNANNSNDTKKSNTTKYNNQSKGKQENTNNKDKNNNMSNIKEKLCIEGGAKHILGSGKNEHGYYKTWDLAWKACQEYMKDMKSGNYYVDECDCGLYYFYVRED